MDNLFVNKTTAHQIILTNKNPLGNTNYLRPEYEIEQLEQLYYSKFNDELTQNIKTPSNKAINCLKNTVPKVNPNIVDTCNNEFIFNISVINTVDYSSGIAISSQTNSYNMALFFSHDLNSISFNEIINRLFELNNSIVNEFDFTSELFEIT